MDEKLEHIGIYRIVTEKISEQPPRDDVSENETVNRKYFLLVMDMAIPAESESAISEGLSVRPGHLYCAAFSDVNGNELYDFGEGIRRLPVIIRSDDFEVEVLTSEAGTQVVPLRPGKYRVTAESNGNLLEKDVDVGTKTVGVWLKFSAGENAGEMP
jgi:hypothetical protein